MAVVLIGMCGWAIYEFVFQSNDLQNSQQSIENESVFESSQESDNTNNTQTEREENEQETEASSAERTVGLEIGNIAPDFQLKTLDGEEATLSDYRGTRVMINFWATWCPPCRAEMPDMEKLYQNTDIEILAINLTETEPHTDQIQRFVDEYELTFPILLDEVIEVATIYAVQPIPTSFIVDSEGIIQFKTFGPLTYDQMVQVFEDIN